MPGLVGYWNTIPARVKYIFWAIVKDKCPSAPFHRFKCTDDTFKISNSFSALINFYVGTHKILGICLCGNPATILSIVLILLLFQD